MNIQYYIPFSRGELLQKYLDAAIKLGEDIAMQMSPDQDMGDLKPVELDMFIVFYWDDDHKDRPYVVDHVFASFSTANLHGERFNNHRVIQVSGHESR